jgi:hypothetical protein
MLVVFLLIVALLSDLAPTKGAMPYKACGHSQAPEVRDLYVASCDSRGGWKEFMAMKTWNATGHPLRTGANNIAMSNVCKGRQWRGFLTKPTLYLEWIKTIPLQSPRGGDNHVILMDSDTFWASNNIGAIWNKYDCARGDKNVLLSTEMSCWIGRYCKPEDLLYYYNHTDETPSYSPYVNSGIVMGKISEVQEMLEYVIANNESYFITYFKHKFDDQYAYADYALKKRPDAVALDYHQQLLASFSIHAPGDPYEDGWPFACKSRDGDTRWGHQNCPSCPNWTPLLAKHGHFRIDADSCQVMRRYWKEMPLQVEMETLAPDPVIWHGNGVGKRTYYHWAHQAFLCNIAKRGFANESSYTDTQCC